MHEIITNLHMHTFYSDGNANHAQIAQAALKAGLDAVIVTDHNVWVDGPEDYYLGGHPEGSKRVLLLVGEEIHDQGRKPQKNHLMVFGAGKELATYAYEPQRLLEAVRQEGGLTFIAHPFDPAAPAVGETDLSWEDWSVQGYTGLELWNAMSEFKSLLKSKLHALWYAYHPEQIASGPFPEVMQRWDNMLAAGQRVVAIGGTDAHALLARMGPLRRTLFPYEFHFRTVNTHLLLERPLTGEVEPDRAAIYDALRRGRAFIGYDLPSPTRGFRFTAAGLDQKAVMGDEISLARQSGVTLQIRLPRPVECRLYQNGKLIKTWPHCETASHIINTPGAYRVEASIDFQGAARGWIYSNPIYVKTS